MAESAELAVRAEAAGEGPANEDGTNDPAGAVSETQGVPAALLVGTIAILVVLVSLPRFRAHALQANREDARVALDVLGTVVFALEWPETLSSTPSLDTIPDVVDATPFLRHRFPDARPTVGSGQLLHHGYRIDTGYVLHGLEQRPALVAWPDEFGKSGDAAYALTSDGALWGHENGGLWTAGANGLSVADLSDEGWIALRPARETQRPARETQRPARETQRPATEARRPAHGN